MAANYRLISLTSCCYKAMEQIEHSHLMKFLESNKLSLKGSSSHIWSVTGYSSRTSPVPGIHQSIALKSSSSVRLFTDD